MERNDRPTAVKRKILFPAVFFCYINVAYIYINCEVSCMFQLKKFKRLTVFGLIAVLIVGSGGIISLGSTSVKAEGNSLPGNTSKYNVFILGDVDVKHSDIEGRLAAGGNVNLNVNYSVGHSLTSEETKEAYSLIAGGNLYYSQGETVGDVVYGGSYSGSGGPRGGTGSLQQQINVVDFAAQFSLLREKSQQLASQPVNGVTTANSGNFFLEGTNSGVNIFTVDGSKLSSANELRIKIPDGSTAIVNISGTTVTMKNMGTGINGNGNKDNAMNSKVLYNFSQATSLQIEGIGVLGSVLAPYASIQFNNGQINGNLIGASLSGSGESHHIPYKGQDPPTATPTP
ncbi:choice-of-anchor A family protein, partial [Paenibacillus phytohabitans]|uniref:choice-of-anchor A family protein n=1 Tax=Paenibacillus phytohabitans TaxID=2654978 RepID=UPI00300B768F